MSTTVALIILGIAAYVVFVSFVLALLTVAGRADEAEAEAHVRHPHVHALRTGRFTSREGEVGDGETTAGDAESRRRARSPSGTGGPAR